MRRRRFLQQALAAMATSAPGLAGAAALGRGPRQRVLIIGAGLAGLSAGYELDRAGHQVRLIEAQSRAGGRVLSLRQPFDDSLYADVGPIYVPDTHALTLHYLQQFGLAVSSQLAPGALPVRLLRGRRLLLQPDREPDWPYALSAEERALGLDGLLQRHLDPLLASIGDPVDEAWRAQDYVHLDRVGLPQLLRERGASAEAVALMTAGWGDLWGDGLAGVSALAVLRDLLLQTGDSHHYRIRGGAEQLPAAFASRLGGRIVYGAQALAIENAARGVRVQIEQAGSRRWLDADRLICAIPFALLRRIAIPASWSAGKREAIAHLRSFSAARVSLQMRERFWLQQGESGAAQTDIGTISSIYDAGMIQPGTRGILQTYSGGTAARAIQAMAPEQRVAFALAQLQRVFPQAGAYFERGIAWCWDEAPFARGASSWFAPGELLRFGAHLSTPENRVHFAGDQTSPWLRWMQGALYSGLRAAREVDEAA